MGEFAPIGGGSSYVPAFIDYVPPQAPRAAEGAEPPLSFVDDPQKWQPEVDAKVENGSYDYFAESRTALTQGGLLNRLSRLAFLSTYIPSQNAQQALDARLNVPSPVATALDQLRAGPVGAAAFIGARVAGASEETQHKLLAAGAVADNAMLGIGSVAQARGGWQPNVPPAARPAAQAGIKNPARPQPVATKAPAPTARQPMPREFSRPPLIDMNAQTSTKRPPGGFDPLAPPVPRENKLCAIGDADAIKGLAESGTVPTPPVSTSKKSIVAAYKNLREERQRAAQAKTEFVATAPFVPKKVELLKAVEAAVHALDHGPVDPQHLTKKGVPLRFEAVRLKPGEEMYFQLAGKFGLEGDRHHCRLLTPHIHGTTQQVMWAGKPSELRKLLPQLREQLEQQKRDSKVLDPALNLRYIESLRLPDAQHAKLPPWMRTLVDDIVAKARELDVAHKEKVHTLLQRDVEVQRKTDQYLSQVRERTRLETRIGALKEATQEQGLQIAELEKSLHKLAPNIVDLPPRPKANGQPDLRRQLSVVRSPAAPLLRQEIAEQLQALRTEYATNTQALAQLAKQLTTLNGPRQREFLSAETTRIDRELDATEVKHARALHQISDTFERAYDLWPWAKRR